MNSVHTYSLYFAKIDFNTLLNLRSGMNFRLKGRELNILTAAYIPEFGVGMP